MRSINDLMLIWIFIVSFILTIGVMSYLSSRLKAAHALGKDTCLVVNESKIGKC